MKDWQMKISDKILKRIGIAMYVPILQKRKYIKNFAKKHNKNEKKELLSN